MENVIQIPTQYKKPSPYKKPKVVYVKRVSQDQLRRLLEQGYTVILR